MELHGVLYHVPGKARSERIELLFTMFKLWDRRDAMTKTFSGGRTGTDSLEAAFLALTGSSLRDESADGKQGMRQLAQRWRRYCSLLSVFLGCANSSDTPGRAYRSWCRSDNRAYTCSRESRYR